MEEDLLHEVLSRAPRSQLAARPGNGKREFLDVGEDQMVRAGLRPAGAGRGTGGVLVAVDEAGDAEDGAGLQLAAADRQQG